MTSPPTHKYTQAAATRPKSRTGRHQQSFLGINCMSSCPQSTHTNNTADGRRRNKLCVQPQKDMTKIKRHLRRGFIKKKKSIRCPIFCPIHGLMSELAPICPWSSGNVGSGQGGTQASNHPPTSSGNVSMMTGSSQRHCVCATGTCG